jgi:F-type H+-transporting ATPase subunit gamma
MEAYKYDTNCHDRFHLLDYNFDEAVIYNTEQVSGLLRLNQEPKNDPTLALQFPLPNPTNIDIVFSKVENKYRFNQFWDITADRGLCGAFNTNIVREATSYIKDELNNENSVSVFTLGKKATEYFSRRNYTIEGKIVGLFSTLEYQSTLQLYNDLVPKYLNGEIDKIVLVYNEFVSMIQQRIVKVQLLPIPLISENKEKVLSNYIFEPDQISIFQSLIPKHLKVQLWRALLESNAAELSARMTAMDNATTNAKELIRSLNLKYNKERQAAITKEILEIVSGANALKASS